MAYGKWLPYIDMESFGYKWVFPKIMVPPNHPFLHRVFHDFHHPFWGSFIFGNPHMNKYRNTLPETNVAILHLKMGWKAPNKHPNQTLFPVSPMATFETPIQLKVWQLRQRNEPPWIGRGGCTGSSAASVTTLGEWIWYASSKWVFVHFVDLGSG